MPCKSKSNWIAGAVQKKGSLRKTLGAKKGKNIPVAKIKKATQGKGKTAKRARLALTLRKFKNK